MTGAISMTEGALLSLSICVLILLWADFKQTLNIKKHPHLHEINPILGRHPTDAAVHLYFAVCAGLFICALLLAYVDAWPVWMSFAWIAGWGAVEAWAVLNNRRLGL
jgi:hypothetical protein